jgi:putative N6-adenine-specific DNA methylase
VAPHLLQGFAVCPAGLEEVLARELTSMPGFRDLEQGRGGVRFAASADAIARANLWARTPTRILIRAGMGRIRKPEDIRIIATNITWEHWFTFRQTMRIDLAVGREPKLDAPLARNYAVLLIKDGICDRFRKVRGERPSIDTAHADIRIWAYLDQNELTLYLDTSGEPLFKRGWRQAKGEAPLRENLAAALVMMTEWDGRSAVMDPCCGSGTLLIEAMQIALRIPPGYNRQSPREFAAEQFHAQSPMGQVNWRALRAEAKQAIDAAQAAASFPKMQGSDSDPRMIRVAQENAARALPAAAANSIQWQQTSFDHAKPIAHQGLLITNPPYGKRLQKDGLQGTSATQASVTREPTTQEPMDPATPAPAGHAGPSFEKQLADALKKSFSGWQAWILTDDLKLEQAMRLKSSRRIPVYNGDIECRWMRFDMVAGSMRDAKAK